MHWSDLKLWYELLSSYHNLIKNPITNQMSNYDAFSIHLFGTQQKYI